MGHQGATDECEARHAVEQAEFSERVGEIEPGCSIRPFAETTPRDLLAIVAKVGRKTLTPFGMTGRDDRQKIWMLQAHLPMRSEHMLLFARVGTCRKPDRTFAKLHLKFGQRRRRRR